MKFFLNNEKVSKLEDTINYHFKDRSLLANALTHSSYANEKHWEKSCCNERLEFLGDAVLELASSEFLFKKMENVQEGELTKVRASMVCEPALAYCARDIKLEQYIMLGRGEDLTGGRNRDSIQSDAFEAVIGAIYLDGGLTNAKEFVYNFVMNDLENKVLFYDSKTIFQEKIQKAGKGTIEYKLISESGPDHDKHFTEAVYVNGKFYGQGEGHTKKAAEQRAAYNALLKIRGGE